MTSLTYQCVQCGHRTTLNFDEDTPIPAAFEGQHRPRGRELCVDCICLGPMVPLEVSEIPQD